MGSFTPNLGLSQPTPGDPAVANLWGGILNVNFGLIDSSISGLLSKSVAGSSNVVLTVSNGATDEARYKGFNFTGILTGNINVLWPGGVTGYFLVKNSTTGAFTLSLGVNNGSGSPVGSVSAIAAGNTGLFYSDGTNVAAQVSLGSLSGTLPILNGGTGATTQAGAQSSLGVPSTTGTGASGTWNINISGTATTATTATTANALNASNSYTMVGLTVNGAINATGNITASASDDRLKRRKWPIGDALHRVKSLDAFVYEFNARGLALGLPEGEEAGLSAQQAQQAMPQVVCASPADPKFLTIRYERVVPYLVQAIKELEEQVVELRRGISGSKGLTG